MIEDFEKVKAQLTELARVVNLFKSEAVQLRVVELVFGGLLESEQGNPPKSESPQRKKTARKRKKPATAEGPAKPKAKKKVASGSGAVATLTQLAEGDFFNTTRTIGDIIEHCRHNLARTFKANEFSGKLGRMVRNGELTRKKNADNQYEYKKA